MNKPALPHLSTAQLEYLVAAVDAPTWAEAAESVGVSQSALSQGLAELQRRLGVPLFERRGRRRVLAAHAEPAVAHARRVLAHTRDLADWAKSVRAGEGGRLRVGMIDSAAIDHFGHVLRSFRETHREVELGLTVAPSSELLIGLDRGELDLVVCIDPEDRPSTALLEEPLYIYGPPDAQLGPPASWTPWVTFPTPSRTRRRIAEALRAAGAPFDVVAETHQPDVLKEMVQLGMGWTVLPATQAERPPNPLTRARSRPLLHRTLVALRRDAAWTEPAAEHLLSALQAEGAHRS